MVRHTDLYTVRGVDLQNRVERYTLGWKNDKGTDMPEGIYYYVIEDLSRQYQNVKGFVYLFRGEK